MRTIQAADGTTLTVGTIYGIGRNYAAHAAELGNAVPGDPVVFLKAAASLRGLQPTGAELVTATPVHHEVELVLLVGREVALGSRPDASVLAGVGLGLDLTRRDVQEACKQQGLPWTTAKSFAGSAVVGPMLRAGDVGDLGQVELSLDVDGVRRQHGRTADMLFPVPAILSFLASQNALDAGDLVFTGTPAGVGPIRPGQRFRMELRGASTWSWEGVL